MVREAPAEENVPTGVAACGIGIASSTVFSEHRLNKPTNLGLQFLVALYQPQNSPAHARHLVVQALAEGDLL